MKSQVTTELVFYEKLCLSASGIFFCGFVLACGGVWLYLEVHTGKLVYYVLPGGVCVACALCLYTMSIHQVSRSLNAAHEEKEEVVYLETPYGRIELDLIEYSLLYPFYYMYIENPPEWIADPSVWNCATIKEIANSEDESLEYEAIMN